MKRPMSSPFRTSGALQVGWTSYPKTIPRRSSPTSLLVRSSSHLPRSLATYSCPLTHFLDPSLQLQESLLKPERAVTHRQSFFKSPLEALEDGGGGAEPQSARPQDEKSLSTGFDSEDDLWIGSDESRRDENPTLQTWESFIKGASHISQPTFLTEAGPSAYDALLSWSIDPLELRNAKTNVIDAKAYFASLLSLALGRESLLFLKSAEGLSFKPVIPDTRITGHSASVLKGLQDLCLTCGCRILELQSFVRRLYSRTSTSRCGVAFASALDEVLQALQENTVVLRANPRSLLQLQATIKGVSAVLSPLYGLTQKLGGDFADEHLISVVFEYTCIVEISENWLREMMQEILRRVSQPWTEFLREWIGTKVEEGILLSKSRLGQSKGFVKVEAEIYTDDMGDQVEEVDFRLDQRKVPNFMPDDIIDTVFETGRNLRFLRSSHPEHPLARLDATASAQPPKADWLFDWESILHLEAQVTSYRDRLLDAVEVSHYTNRAGTDPFRIAPMAVGESPADIFAFSERRMEEHILTSMDLLDTPVTVSTSQSTLRNVIRTRLGADRQPRSSHPEARPHWSLLPVLSFGSIAAAQAQVINRETLRQLFKSHDLRKHLSLQRDFHLFGSGQFSSRLSHALFDPDLERADRQAGVARQGGVMGLRLGGRDTWPPASSELRLALMGVLVESYDAQNHPASASSALSRDSSELPGDLSFAVRDLSEEEIDKCMNPDSLEAMDFLRLSYKAPAALGFIITPLILMQYDRIFKLLLRVLRIVYVVDQLWRETATRNENKGDVSCRFVREARNFTTNVASYFLDVGIAVPWLAFEEKLDKIQVSLDDRLTEHVESPDQLREFHANVLNSMMLALFLRKRQQPVLKLLEEIFSIILEYAMVSRKRESLNDEHKLPGPGELYGRLKRKIQVFLTVCKGLAERGRSVSKGDELKGIGLDGMGDDSMIAQLLMRLDINDYYAKH